MLPSNTVPACLMGRASPCPQQWKVKWLWKNSVKPFAITLRRRQQQNGNSAWISCPRGWQTERRRTETSTMQGLPAVSPAPSAYTPPYTWQTRSVPMPQAPIPRIPPFEHTTQVEACSQNSAETHQSQNGRQPREDAAGLRASHRQSLRFVHSCYLAGACPGGLRILMEAAATCAGNSDEPIRSALPLMPLVMPLVVLQLTHTGFAVVCKPGKL